MGDYVLVLDHFDSFVHVLADQLASASGAEVDVVRADVTLAEWTALLAERRPTLVVLSPGPGHPRAAALARAWLATRPDLPVLGVCLGHQILGLVEGAQIVRGPAPVHGVACEVEWREAFPGAQVPDRMPVARYHSLVVEQLPPTLRATAKTRTPDGDELVMAMRHTERPWTGLQFHPESVLTPHGSAILAAAVAQGRRVIGDAREVEV